VKNYELKQEAYIEKYFNLSQPNPKGWRTNLSGCPYCFDGKSKTPRSHFIIKDNQIGFHCFNCGAKKRFTGSNIHSLAAFISKASWKKLGNVLLELKKEKIFPEMDITKQEEIADKVEKDKLDLITYKEIELPKHCVPLSTKKEDLTPKYQPIFRQYKKSALEYLKNHAVENHPKVKELQICLKGDFKGRLIIPIYFDDKLISYVGRALFPTRTKFLYPPSDDNFNERGKIIYNLDLLIHKRFNHKQIFITESIFDAWVLNGMAVLSKNITDEQMEILENFNIQNKKLVFVLDKDEVDFRKRDMKGLDLGKSVFERGNDNWFVSYPDFNSDVKDVCDSTYKYGMLETYDKIMEGIVKGNFELDLKAKLASVGGFGKSGKSNTKTLKYYSKDWDE